MFTPMFVLLAPLFIVFIPYLFCLKYVCMACMHVQLKGLVLKVTKSHFAKIEVIPTMLFT